MRSLLPGMFSLAPRFLCTRPTSPSYHISQLHATARQAFLSISASARFVKESPISSSRHAAGLSAILSTTWAWPRSVNEPSRPAIPTVASLGNASSSNMHQLLHPVDPRAGRLSRLNFSWLSIGSMIEWLSSACQESLDPIGRRCISNAGCHVS